MASKGKGKQWIASVALVAWLALLIRVIVFKAIPTIRIGRRVYRLGGRTYTGPPNFTPLKTIARQWHGHTHDLMSKVNLLGNVLPFVPVGLLAPLVFRKMNWPRALLLALGTGLLMEVLEAVFRVGIFDVDDILLNAVGVLIGYGLHQML